MMRRQSPVWLLLMFSILFVAPAEGGQIDLSPVEVLEDSEENRREAKDEAAWVRVMTLTYPAYVIEPETRYHPQLIELAEALKLPERRKDRIVLKGYTDSSGDRTANRRISMERAASLKKLLSEHPAMGVAEDRIIAEGLGDADPVAPNATPEGRAKNRRVEIYLSSRVDEPAKLHFTQAPAADTGQARAETVSAAAPPPKPSEESRPEDAASASGPEPVRLSLFDAIRYGLEGNQDIHVVSFEPKQAREELADAESVYDPEFFADSRFRRDPNLQSSVTRVVMEDDGLFQTGIRKPLPTGGSLSGSLAMRYGDLLNSELDRTYKYTFAPTVELRQPLLKNIGAREEKTAIQIANYRFTISEEEFRQKAIDITARISQAYWRLYLLREFSVIDRQNFEMAEEVLRREKVRVAEGLSQSIDVERARSNAQSRRSNLLQSRQRLQVAMDQLKLLMNWSNLTIDSAAVIIPTEEPRTEPIDVPEKAAIEKALANRPEVNKAGQQLEISRAEEDLYRHRRLPTLDVFGLYAVSGYGDDVSTAFDDTAFNQEDSWAVGLNFAYPIGNRSAIARSRSKTIQRRQSEAQVDRIRTQIKQEVKEVLLSIAFAMGEIESTRTAKASAAKVVEGEFARFEIGQTTNEELLRAQDLLAATSRNYARAVVDYSIAKANLARAVGQLPDGVSIEDASR